jgi:ABC-type transport system involved in cytochrome bd biosynthesis fused ATPase/permease subunit
VLLLEDVTAEAAGRRVFDGLDLAVRRGERFGVVCDDQATMQAIVELLAGHRRPTRGRVRVDGIDPVRDAALLTGRIAVLTDGLEVLIDGLAVEVALSAGTRVPDRLPRRNAPDATGADVWLVLDQRTAGDRQRQASDDLTARFEPIHLDQHRTVLLATSDPRLAHAVCDRTVRISTRTANTATPTPTSTPTITTPQAHHHLEGGTS